VDDNEYIDFVSGLCPIILGYCDEDVDNAVREQMKKGVIFSLPHPLEIEVSELLQEMIPCAEMVRLAKNGSDATSGAIRLARAFTGKDHVVTVNGHYHGWQDWAVSITGRNAGVPSCVRSLTHICEYDDEDSLEQVFSQYPNQIAAVIFEPMNTQWPYSLQHIKEIVHKNNALLIFDEIITGLRFPECSAQKYFKVTPDLACFGKAIANGYPLSAVVGKREIMEQMEKIHFSFTFGGECLSLAAAKATLTKIKTQPVLSKILRMGDRIEKYFSKFNWLKLLGYPSRTVIKFNADTDRLKFMQECFQRGIFIIDAHNLTYSHSDQDIDLLLAAYDEILPNLDSIELKGQIHDSKFKVRWY
jgi:glutamate-1-semialdehyde 2,1-aminomutase